MIQFNMVRGMLKMTNKAGREKMYNYYRTSDMLNLLYFFPELSPVLELVIVESEEDYLNNKDYLDSFEQNRVDTLKGRTPILGIENAGKSDGFFATLKEVKKKDPLGVLVLFKVRNVPTERYERMAGITVAVELGEYVIIEAVSKGFDGREVSKSICVHERYYIPWFELRRVNVSNFRNYQTYVITNEEYQVTRIERIEFLKSIGLDPNCFCKYIPENYCLIPDIIWQSVIKNCLKKLEKNEESLRNCGFTSFAISGHTEGNDFAPWHMFDKSRYTLQTK